MKLRQVASNVTELELNNGTVVMFSYETPVAAFIPGSGCIRSEEKYSRTTSKHVTQWIDGRSYATVPQSEIDKLVN